ncbi:hypothetical protein D3C76_1007120 [compost metagenome]
MLLGQALMHALGHLPSVIAIVIATVFLGAIHGGIGMAQQLLGAVAMFGAQGNADTGRDHCCRTVEHEGMLQRQQ